MSPYREPAIVTAPEAPRRRVMHLGIGDAVRVAPADENASMAVIRHGCAIGRVAMVLGTVLLVTFEGDASALFLQSELSPYR